jgi:hypothetical protein
MNWSLLLEGAPTRYRDGTTRTPGENGLPRSAAAKTQD